MSAKTPKLIDKQAILDQLAGELPLVRDKDYETKVESIPSGSISLDLAIGVGGYPRGAIIDVFGRESAGKSLLSIMAIAQVQKLGGMAVVWDAERSYSKNLTWMRINGVDTTKLRFLRLRATQGAEIGFDAIEKICKASAADLIVVDSVPALIPQAVLDVAFDENAKVAAQANLFSRVLPRLAGHCDEGKTSVMFINQMRSNVGGGKWEPSLKETSIWALKHFASIRMQVKKNSKSVIVDDLPASHRVHVDIVKNKVSAPYRQAEFDINYLHGVDNSSEAAEILVAAGKIVQAGAWFTYGKERFQGLEKLAAYFKDPEIYAKAVAEIKSLTNVNAFGVKKLEGDNNENKEDGLKIEESED